MFRLGWTAAMLAVLAGGCRTARPVGSPIAPLGATSPQQAIELLRQRTATFAGARSLMRVRATTGGRTQSFRAQLAVENRERMTLIAYTPVGTTAMTLRADGKNVSVDNQIEGTEWKGTADELARSLGFLGGELLPAETAMLLLGYPPASPDVDVEASASGLVTARSGDVSVAFDPPSFPATKVVLTRGADRIEIEHLEIVSGSEE